MSEMIVEMLGEICNTCGIVFQTTKEHQEARKKDHESFYCPAGHSQYYISKSGIEKERVAREKAEKDRDWYKGRLTATGNVLSREERSNNALRGQITRLKKRIVQGQCPFCGKSLVGRGHSFHNLREHIQFHHPNMLKKYGVKK